MNTENNPWNSNLTYEQRDNLIKETLVPLKKILEIRKVTMFTEDSRLANYAHPDNMEDKLTIQLGGPHSPYTRLVESCEIKESYSWSPLRLKLSQVYIKKEQLSGDELLQYAIVKYELYPEKLEETYYSLQEKNLKR